MSNTTVEDLPGSWTPTLPEVTITPENVEQFACNYPGCDRTFARQQQLIGHKASHAKEGRGRQPCPECRKMYLPGPGMASHRSKAHGVLGQKHQQKQQQQPHFAATAKASPELGAEDILHGTLTMLYPGGKIPIHAVVPLMRWRDATEDMLREINGK